LPTPLAWVTLATVTMCKGGGKYKSWKLWQMTICDISYSENKAIAHKVRTLSVSNRLAAKRIGVGKMLSKWLFKIRTTAVFIARLLRMCEKFKDFSRTLKLHFQGPVLEGSLQHGQYYNNI